ncbi:MAG: DAK2 domain-containing protein [Negativicutes bacterium]|nr:DAK2 domain-containing protein [Negativicutes bacterium]
MAEELTKDFLDADDLCRMYFAAANQLLKQRDQINALNVFPVPDGDTGTNMYLTLKSAVDELSAMDHLTVGKVTGAISMGALMGARGNSGVILSQLFRGFSRQMENKEKINTGDYAKAMQEGVNAAYKAVMRPTEGTILTVAKEAAKEALVNARSHKDFVVFFELIVKKSEEALQKTPSQLAVLKQAGVVDAGGAGLLAIYQGFLQGISGKGGEIELPVEEKPQSSSPTSVAQSVVQNSAEIEFAYCTEMIILGEKLDQDHLLQELTPLGDSLMVVGDPKILKVHVHTNHPGKALEYALAMGNLSRVKVENMREQHHHLLLQNEEQTAAGETAAPVTEMKSAGVAAVAAGSGLIDIFHSLGVDFVVEGGQTMNPSTEDIVKAIGQVPAEHVFVLPNNKNIILAAEQAAGLSEKKVYVVPTKNVPQGIASLLAFSPESTDYAAMQQAMLQAANLIRTGQVTHAVRNSTVQGQVIAEGDYLALCEDDIVGSGSDMEIVLKLLLNSLLRDHPEIITIYYGEEVSQTEAEALQKQLQADYPDLEVELYYGGQPVYYYILSAE